MPADLPKIQHASIIMCELTVRCAKQCWKPCLSSTLLDYRTPPPSNMNRAGVLYSGQG